MDGDLSHFSNHLGQLDRFVVKVPSVDQTCICRLPSPGTEETPVFWFLLFFLLVFLTLLFFFFPDRLSLLADGVHFHPKLLFVIFQLTVLRFFKHHPYFNGTMKAVFEYSGQILGQRIPLSLRHNGVCHLKKQDIAVLKAVLAVLQHIPFYHAAFV